MSVYVDDMRAPFRRMIMFHMIADGDGELHEMADRIGIARRWYQGDHYDICLAKRELAVVAGAVEIAMRQCGAMTYLRKLGEPIGDPETSVKRMLTVIGEQKSAREAKL